jgi:hypothetical protein
VLLGPLHVFLVAPLDHLFRVEVYFYGRHLGSEPALAILGVGCGFCWVCFLGPESSPCYIISLDSIFSTVYLQAALT